MAIGIFPKVALGLAAAAIIYMVYMTYFGGKGTRVHFEWYKLIDGRHIRHKPDKKFKARNVREGTTEKLILPKNICKLPVEGLRPEDYQQTTAGIFIVKLLQIGEDHFVPMHQKNDLQKEILKSQEGSEDTNKIKYTANYVDMVTERDVAYWAENAVRDIEERHKVESKWDKYKPFITLGLVAIVCLLLVAHTINKTSEMVDKAAEETWGQIQESKWDIQRLIKIGESMTGTDTGTVPTNATKPPGR